MTKTKFLFENLDVWQKAVDFSSKVIDLADTIETDRKHYRLFEQLEAASTSISLNIAEGKGRFSKKEFVQFLYIARGSLYETVTLLIIFQRKGWVSDSKLQELELSAEEIGKMLSNLIVSIKKSFN
jgi:four helix bundle protein